MDAVAPQQGSAELPATRAVLPGSGLSCVLPSVSPRRLLFSKVKLESLSRGPDEALLTCKHMLQIWKSCYNLTNPR